MKKTTYIDALNYVLTYVAEHTEIPTNVLERLDALKVSLEKRATTPHKPSKKQVKANQHTDILVLEVMMNSEEPVCAKDIMAANEELASGSIQRVSASCARLVNMGKLEKLEGRPVKYRVKA